MRSLAGIFLRVGPNRCPGVVSEVPGEKMGFGCASKENQPGGRVSSVLGSGALTFARLLACLHGGRSGVTQPTPMITSDRRTHYLDLLGLSAGEVFFGYP